VEMAIGGAESKVSVDREAVGCGKSTLYRSWAASLPRPKAEYRL